MQICKSTIPVPNGTTTSPQARMEVKVWLQDEKNSFSIQKILSFQTSRGGRVIRLSREGRNRDKAGRGLTIFNCLYKIRVVDKNAHMLGLKRKIYVQHPKNFGLIDFRFKRFFRGWFQIH
jgi:hypothetical protein